MKKLFFLGEEYTAEKIIKRENSIIGIDNGEQSFEFNGISDFTQYEVLDSNNNISNFDMFLTETEMLMLAITELAETMLGGA